MTEMNLSLRHVGVYVIWRGCLAEKISLSPVAVKTSKHVEKEEEEQQQHQQKNKKKIDSVITWDVALGS